MEFLTRRALPAAAAATWMLAAPSVAHAAEPPADQTQNGQAAARVEPPAEASPDDEADAGPSLALGLGGIATGVAGVAAGVAFLFAGADRGDEAAALRDEVKTDPSMALVTSDHCTHPNRPPACDELESAADERVLFNTAGYLLMSGGVAMALAGAMYLTMGINDDDVAEVSVHVAPAAGASGWGVAVAGSF